MMRWIQTLFSGGDTVKAIGDTVDKLFTSDDERLERENERQKADNNYNLEVKKIDASLALSQVEVNKIEAASNNWFAAGWRPAIGWVGAAALAYKFIIYQFMCWIITFYPGVTLPPSPNSDELYPIIFGMLGLGTMRMVEKVKGKNKY